ncbi:MAG: hypothetical protein CM1200mP40_13210 [Gammaproteobacteria bacterium]|nr:MAG: hypothetical protein CM1200mP40_13210 [Gammaproteobacteria bacterium]
MQLIVSSKERLIRFRYIAKRNFPVIKSIHEVLLHKIFKLMPLVCLQLLSINSQAQISLPQITQLDESNVNILLDGFIDEAVWQSLPIIDNMKIIDPDTLEDAPYKTDIRFFYTHKEFTLVL